MELTRINSNNPIFFTWIFILHNHFLVIYLRPEDLNKPQYFWKKMNLLIYLQMRNICSCTCGPGNFSDPTTPRKLDKDNAFCYNKFCDL